MDDFIIRALIAGFGIAVFGGVLGCFVVWRKMAYFGDSLAHSGLLGIALGLIYSLNIHIASVIIVSLFALLLVWLSEKRILATDTLLGILAHTALSVGIIVLSLVGYQGVDLHSYLFGDMFIVSNTHLGWIYTVGLIVLILIYKNWQALVLISIDKEVAQAEGIHTMRLNLLLTFMIAAVIAVAIQTVGILLITSLLIIPAAAARQLAKTPDTMALLSCVVALGAVSSGVSASIVFDIPSTPSIVVSAAIIFTLLLIIRTVLGQK